MKNNRFLKVYAIIVVILLVLIFIAPNSFIERHSRFRKYYEMLDRMKDNDSKSESQTPSIVVIPYKEQLESLSKNKYSYEYLLDHKSEIYKCKGRIDEQYNQGRCTSPKEEEYTTDTSKNVFKSLETKYLDIPQLIELIKDTEYKEVKLGERTNYVYEIENGKTEVTIQSDQSKIVEILINKGYLVYQIKISNIEK